MCNWNHIIVVPEQRVCMQVVTVVQLLDRNVAFTRHTLWWFFMSLCVFSHTWYISSFLSLPKSYFSIPRTPIVSRTLRLDTPPHKFPDFCFGSHIFSLPSAQTQICQLYLEAFTPTSKGLLEDREKKKGEMEINYESRHLEVRSFDLSVQY